MFIGEYNKSVILTYIGICTSILGIAYAFKENYDYAFICLILAGIVDLFDGVIARRCKRTDSAKEFGVQIDSLADVISFLVFPAIILLKKYLATSGLNIAVYMGVICIYVLAGVIRLAYFNVHVETMRQYYLGVPVTYVALILPIYYVISKATNVSDLYYIVIYLAMAVLFVLKLKVKKPKGMWYIIFSLMAILTILGIIFI